MKSNINNVLKVTRGFNRVQILTPKCSHYLRTECAVNSHSRSYCWSNVSSVVNSACHMRCLLFIHLVRNACDRTTVSFSRWNSSLKKLPAYFYFQWVWHLSQWWRCLLLQHSMKYKLIVQGTGGSVVGFSSIMRRLGFDSKPMDAVQVTGQGIQWEGCVRR